MIEAGTGSPEIKQCCAAAYGSEAARFLLGESFHPGGVDLTLELGGLLGLTADSRVSWMSPRAAERVRLRSRNASAAA